jgi:thioredoxin reductase (NADPH)
VDRAYEVIIIGGGPAGLTAGLYTSRARLGTLLLERGIMGGQIVNAEVVENYPGFPEGISGFELGELLHRQATKYDLETLFAEVRGIEFQGVDKAVKTDQGDFIAKALIIAGGSEYRRLGISGEEELIGRGVSFCATCDAALFKDQVVAVAGGGDTALTDALFLTKFASRVIVIHRRDELRASKILQEKAFADPKMEFLWDTVVAGIQGDSKVRELELRQVKTGERSSLEVAAIFVCVGLRPNTAYLEGILRLDDMGHIITNEQMETDRPGVFAAGDIRHHSARQAVTAAGDGATAALSAEKFLKDQG